MPRWTRSYPVRALRFLIFQALMIPLFRGLLTLTVEGLENLRNIDPPCLFASNHQSDLDTPAILAALPLALALSRCAGHVPGLLPRVARARTAHR